MKFKHLLSKRTLFIVILVVLAILAIAASGDKVLWLWGKHLRVDGGSTYFKNTAEVGDSLIIGNSGTSTISTLPAGTFIYLSGNGKITRLIPPSLRGRLVYFVCSGTDTLVDGVNLKLAGDFNGTSADVIGLYYAPLERDTSWYEISRSVN